MCLAVLSSTCLFVPIVRAAAMNNLAQAYGNQRRDGEAEPLFERAIAVVDKGAAR